MSRRSRRTALEQAFDALGPEARQFHLGLKRQPVKTGVHLRRLLGLARVYGSTEVLSAIAKALEFAAYDAAYVENLSAGRTPAPAASHAHSADSATARADR